MSEKFEEKAWMIQKCIETMEKLPMRIGTSIYVRISEGRKYQMMDIKSKELFEFMFRKMFQQKLLIDKRIWKATIDYVLGGYTMERMTEQKNRIGKEKDNIYYDILDINTCEPHFVKITPKGWKVEKGNLDNYTWNAFQKEQVIPDESIQDIKRVFKYVNIKKEDEVMFIAYLVSCFIPDIQHPILNIYGGHATGKSTISKVIKDLVDPSKAPTNDLSDGEDGIRLPLSQNYLTVFDNIEKLPSKLNALFCRAVTGGETMKRKLYSNNEMIAIPLKSIVVMNGITSAIRREDLMSRTVFLQTKAVGKGEGKGYGRLWKEFQEDKKYILAGIFDVLSKAMNLLDNIVVSDYYRMFEFTTWGYAIAEALEEGLGSQFLKLMKENETIQLQETYANEPLITLIMNYMTLRQGEEVYQTTSVFYDEIMRRADSYMGVGAEYSRRFLPATAAAFSKKVNALKGVFAKLGINIEIDRTGDVRNISRISIEMIREEEKQVVVEKEVKETIKRVPIIGIRKAVIFHKG